MDKNQLGIKQMQEGNLEEAVKLFTEVIEEHPSDPVGYINFGNVLLSMDDFERAELFFKRALELDDTVPAAYYSLGNLYYELERYQEAADSSKMPQNKEWKMVICFSC